MGSDGREKRLNDIMVLKKDLLLRPCLLVCAAIGCVEIGYILGSGSKDLAGTIKLPMTSANNLVGNSNCPSLMKGPGVPTFKSRGDLGAVMQSEHFTIGLELGVQSGSYSKTILSKWPSCEKYHLVDVWAHQENYKDLANANQAQQDALYQVTLDNTAQWKEKINVCRNFTSNCVHTFDDEYFDFIYVDARHDYKGVYEDLVNYWPKLKVGGIFAGHDYVTQDDGPSPAQNWTVNYDGTIDETGTVVKGAVDKFATSVCRQVTVSYRESAWNTWAMRK